MAPVLGVGKVDQAVVAGLGAKRELIHIAAQGAGDLHAASNPLKSRRVIALILYVRCAIGAHNAIVPELVGELAVRATTGSEVLDPGVVLVVIGLGSIGHHDRCACEPKDGKRKEKAGALVPSSKMWSLTMCSST